MRDSSISRNLGRLQEAIRAGAESCARDPAEISLLAVSKTFEAAAVGQAWQAGQKSFGENRVQEAQEKIPQLAQLDIEWHLIGHLQSNKVKRAVELFDVIQTIDSEKIARRISRCAQELGKVQQVYLQVNIGAESQKSGILPEQVPSLGELLSRLPSLELLGLMAIPPYHPDPERSRPYFRRLAELLPLLNRRLERPLRGLSMGMSHDFEVAIEEGATLLRIGTAIFGPRSL